MKKLSVSLLGLLAIVFALTSAFTAPQAASFDSEEYVLFGNPAHTNSPSAQDLFGQDEELAEAYFDVEENEAFVLDMSDEDVQNTYCPTPLTPVCAAILKITRNGLGQITSIVIVKVWQGTFSI